MRPSFLTRIFAATLFLIVAMAVNMTLTQKNVVELNDDFRWLVHTHIVRTDLALLLRYVDEAETGQRGYIITGDESYLLPYEHALKMVPQKLNELKTVTKDNPVQVARVSRVNTAIQERLAELKRVIDLRKSSGIEAARQRIDTGHGKQLMSEVRSLINDMDLEEQNLLDLRTRHAVWSYDQARTTGLVSGIASMIAILGFFWLLLSHMRSRIKASSIIEAQSEELRVTLNSIGDAVMTTDNEGRVQSMNPIAEELTGWTTSEAHGHMLEEVFVIVNETTREPVENPAVRALRTGTIVGLANHTVLISKDGTERPIDDSAAPIRGANGITGVVLVFRDVSERRAHDNKLARSEGLLADFFENANVGLHWKSPEGIILRVNKAELELLGYSSDEFVGQCITDFHVDKNVSKKILEDLRAGKPVKDRPAKLICKDGSIKEVLINSNSYVQDGTFVHSRSFTLDVTDRNRAERALRETDSNLHMALESGRMGSWEWEIATGKVTWTHSLEEIFGFMPGEFPGTYEAYQERIHPDDRLDVREQIRKALDKGIDYRTEHRVCWPDGSIHWVSGRGAVLKDESGEPIRMIGVSMDVTERKKSEQDAKFLAEASVLLSELVDYRSTLETVARLAVPRFADWCTVDVLEEDGSINRLAIVHTDETKVQHVRQLHEEYRGDPTANMTIRRVITSGASEMVGLVSEEMIRSVVPDERRLEIIREAGLHSYIVVPLAVHSKVFGAISFVTAESFRTYDNDDLKFAEDLARRAAIAIENAKLYQEAREADLRKDEFLATLAHELRNPLAPMSLALEVMRQTESDIERNEQARGIIERQLDHLVRLVDDLLDVSRITRDKLELRRVRVDLRTVVQQAIEIARPVIESKGHELTIGLPEKPIMVNADPTRLAQVFSNLLNNASKFTLAHGHLWIDVEPDNVHAVVRVRDNGIGLSAEMLPKIFDMFTQAENSMEQARGGLGIGLTLAKRLVELHGGTISAMSGGEGQGCTFQVSLPLNPAEPSDNDRNSHSAVRRDDPHQREQLRVLVVDDNADSARMLSTMLEIEGHKTWVRFNGVDAVNAAAELQPDLVFMDIGLPGLSGYEAAERIRINPENVGMTLVAITGWGQEQDRKRSKEAGFDIHLVKPVPMASLKELISGMVPRKQAQHDGTETRR